MRSLIELDQICISSKSLTLNHPQPKPRQVDMPFYSLLILGENKSLFTPARDRNEALALFGRELNLKLTLDDSDTVIARYLLDEWDFPGPHWVDHTIPVFEMLADAN
jgi:hypothetical protein